MESVQQSSPRWMLRNTFLEVVDDASDSDGFSSCLMRANSDSVLYEGYSRRNAAEHSEHETKSGKEESPNSSEESMESELDSWSDAETTPDTMEGEKSFPLPCYHHIADSPSGRSTPAAAGQYVAQTPSPRCMDWPATSFADTCLPTEEIRSDPMPDLVPPTHSQVPEAHSAGKRDVSRHALQRLMAEVAKLEQENELLRRLAQEPGPGQEVRSQGDAQAVNLSQQDSGTSWTAVLMPAGLVPASSSSSQMPFSAETWTSSYGPHPDLTVASTMPRRRRMRSRKGNAALEAELSLPRASQSPTQAKSTECDKPMEEWTTVMLRNLPNNYKRSMILALLDKEGFEGKYNFLYLPIDFRTRACMGYAFVNLVDPAYVPDFWAKFSGYSNWVVRSKKLCGVSWSEPHQGLESHVERYRNSPIMHESVPDEYGPIVLQNGIRVAFPEPSKSSRPPRSRHPTNQFDGKVHGSRHKRHTSADAARKLSGRVRGPRPGR